jgi:single-strand DNA-binding protein
MPSFNSCTVVGNCTREIDVRYTPKGTAVAEIGLAVNETYKVGEEKREKTLFLEVKVWGRTAELAGEYLKKGSCVLFSGRLDQESWDDKQTGQKRSKIVIVADTMQFLSSPTGDRKGGQHEARPPQGRPAGKPKPPTDPDLDVEEDDIPF